MELNRKKIGVFDSGVGGFSILQELLNVLSGHEFFYISDKPNSPYGDKTSSFIAQRCQILTDELLKQNVDLILVACNTATAEGIDYLRSRYSIPFVGIEPFVKSIETLDMNDSQLRPVVLSTPAMHESQRFMNLLTKYDPDKRIETFPCPNLATLIERAYVDGFSTIENEVEQELRSLKGRSLTHAILGCTHYPLIAHKISDYLSVECISPCLPVAKRVAQILAVEPLKSASTLHFKTSDQENFDSLDTALLSLN